MINQDKNNQIIIYSGANEVKHSVALRRHPSFRWEFSEAGWYEFPSCRGVPERRGVFSERGEEHPVIASQCHPSGRGESAPCVLKWHELPFNPKLKQRAGELRKAGNLSEVLFWNQIKNKKFLNLDFDRQKIIGNYIVDFYCKDLGAVVEIDGESHNEKQEYDIERDNYLESFGLKIFHIQDIDIKKNIAEVLGFLRKRLTHCLKEGDNTPPYGHPSKKTGIMNKEIK